MVNAAEYPDCTNQCKSHQHGEIITSAISKRGVSDSDLCAFLNYTCCRCESVTDYSGRSALHVAASCGRLHLVKWLVCKKNADIDAKDKESGYTALHRSIFYGQIHVAVELIKLGASIALLDQECLTAFEHSMKDGLKPTSSHGDLFYWGSNNNNLFGSVQARDVPDLLDFHKRYPEESVKKICIEQFHIVILTLSGNIYSCGHGREGRLGLGNEGSYVVPHIVKISNTQKEEPVFCIDVDISRDHSIFLFSDKSVYTCGLNQYMVLGHMPPPDRLLTPKPIKNFSSKNTVGICARRYHSLAWNASAVYAWGLNAGQFGPRTGENNNQFTVTPKRVNMGHDFNILTVVASDGATVVVTDRGTIYVFHEYQCKKIASKQTNVLKVCVLGGNLDSKLLESEKQKENKELKVAVLLRSGDVFLWQESDQQLCRCVYSINRVVIVKHIFLNRNELLLVTEYGEGFKGLVRPRKKKKINQNDKSPKSTEKKALSRLLEKDDCIYVSLEKVPKIHRAFFIQSDIKGKDYCIIQVHPYKYMVNAQQKDSEMIFDLKKFLEMTISDDGVADINFRLKNGSCSGHRYILLSRCSHFDTKISRSTESVVNLTEVDCYVFQQFLTFVYTGDCDFLHAYQIENSYFQKKSETKNEADTATKSKENIISPIESLRRLAKNFGCTSLLDRLNKPSPLKNFNSVKEQFVFSRFQHQNLYDITLKCTDGEINAHRCILSARMEYFGNMLSNRWSGNEVTKVSLPFPKRTVELLLEFLYIDSLPAVTDIDIDNLLKLLVLADQFFVAKLKEQCETFLSEKMSFKNTVEILSFAHMYNAHKLKRCCIKFITLNMPAFLDLGYLNDLQVEILEEISLIYFEEKNLSCRVITPYSEAVSDDVLIGIANKYPVVTNVLENKPVLKSDQKKKSRSHKTSFSKKEKLTSFEKETIVENDVFVVKTVVNDDVNTNQTTDAFKRIISINKAAEVMKSENVPINYVKLNPNDSSSSFENSFIDSSDFPELGSSFGNSNEYLSPKNYQHRNESKHKIVKMSQKQRKKLNSESDDGQTKPALEIKKSPWKTNFDLGSPISSPETVFTMSDIISNEKKQKENLVKITNKLLLYTQMEDRAMEELNKFYNVQETLDEIISIQRVDTGAIASPFWVPKTK